MMAAPDRDGAEMTERFFRLIVGSLLLGALYFELPALVPALIAVLTLEGATNYRIPLVLARWRAAGAPEFEDSGESLSDGRAPRFAFDAERAWRLAVAAMLALTTYVFHEQLWFFPWFMGFAIFGAGLSGVCPVLISLKLLGFR